jgi:multiple sugar transport system permease protein
VSTTTTAAPRRAEPRSATARTRRRRETVRNLAFLSPWLLGTGLFFVYPLLSTAYFSFTHYNGFSPPTFDGLQNWRFVFQSYPFFWPALRNTLWLVAVMVTLRVVFGLAVGMLVVRIKRGAGLLRTFFYAPYLAPPVAGTLAFVFLLNPGTGPVNTILGRLGLPEPGWFNDPAWSKPALTLLALWGIGDLMVIFMASLLDVPRELYEAADLDGADTWQKFRYVTWPGLRATRTFILITITISAFALFTQVNIMTQGGPLDSTSTLVLMAVRTGFQQQQTGYASAISLAFFVLVLAVTLVNRYFTRDKDVVR